jgi:hypothetical protein
VDLAKLFRTALNQVWLRGHTPWELLPTALVQSCVRVLAIDGAGISLTQDLRVPLGFSDELSAEAERIQVTLGEGPCLTAARTKKPVIADLDGMAGRWPLFQRQLVAKTPFRSVASVPLGMHRMLPFGAMDLYSTRPDGAVFPEIDQLESAIAGTASRFLLAAPTTMDATGTVMPAWFDTQPARHRMQVWSAVGMLTARSRLSSADALDLLRSYAFGHDLTLDDLARQLLQGSLLVRVMLTSDSES